MTDYEEQPDLMSLLRQSCVRLCDSDNPARWGTGFFIASDVLLTCWHVVQDIHNQRILVQYPRHAPIEDQCPQFMVLGEAILLEQGDPWDLALLDFTPADAAALSAMEGIGPMVLPLVEQDPSLESRLVTTAYPEDAGSRHDATYEAAGRTTPLGQSMEFLRIKADGVVPGFSGSPLLDLETQKVCGVVARNELTGGAIDGGLAVPLAVFRAAFPDKGEALLRRNMVECHPRFTTTTKRRGRSAWTWPKPWDFTTYLCEKREGFVGRQWLFEEVRDWATNSDSEQALLICADYGVGKSAFLAELLDTGAAGLPVVAHHFCRADLNDTLAPGSFVRNLAGQLAMALPAYRALVEANEAKELREKLDQAEHRPLPALDQAVLAPLRRIEAPPQQQLLVIDALDEAEDPAYNSSTHRQSNTPSIVQLLAAYSQHFPAWLKVLATSRRRDYLLNTLQQAFALKEINAEEGRNLSDLFTYTRARCERSPLTDRLASADLTAAEVAEFLSREHQSSGKFLYVARVLSDLERGLLPLANRTDLEKLAPGLDRFYIQTFERRFPSASDFSPVQPLLGLLCVQREPLSYSELSAILDVSTDQIVTWLLPLEDLLRFQPFTLHGAYSSTQQDWRISFDHVSLEQWLTERSGGRLPRARAGRFWVDREQAAEQIHTWALAEVAANRAHNWPYLVRHLASHLTNEERAGVIGGLLTQFPWLENRLRLAGLNALIGDLNPNIYEPNDLPKELGRLQHTLRQAAHVLGHEEGWNGKEQLASQLLARMPDDGTLQELRNQTSEILRQIGGAKPIAATLVGHEALLRTFVAESGINVVISLSETHFATGSIDNKIRLLDIAAGTFTMVLEGHQGSVNALTLLSNGHLASGSDDHNIRLWDLATGECTAVLEGHQGWVRSLALLSNGCLASGSDDHSIRLWDVETGKCTAVLEGHRGWVRSLVALTNGRLASGSRDCTIRLWEPTTHHCTAVLEGHQGLVRSLVALNDDCLASGSNDATIRLWDLTNSCCTAIFSEHKRSVLSLAVLGDSHLASGSGDNTIRLWDLRSGKCNAVLAGHTSKVSSLAVLGNGRLVSSSEDKTIRFWVPDNEDSIVVSENEWRSVSSLAILCNGHIASGYSDNKIQLWHPLGMGSVKAFEGHGSPVCCLSVMGDRRIVSGHSDSTICLWDPDTGDCTAVFKGHRGGVSSLAVLCDGRFASGSRDMDVRIWDSGSGECTTIFSEHRRSVLSLAVIGDSHLASGSGDNSIRLWDLRSGKCSAVFDGHTSKVCSLAGLEDGRLVSGSEDNTIRIWDLASSSCSAVYEGHAGSVLALADLGDGRLVSGGDDATIRVWDLTGSGGSPRVSFVADAAISALVWNVTHQLLVAGDANGRLHWLYIPPLTI